MVYNPIGAFCGTERWIISMKILIFGGTGRISRDVVAVFLKNNFEVWTVNRGYRENLLGVNVILCDVNNYEKMRRELMPFRFDIIIDFLSYNLKDIIEKTNLFDYNIKKYIFISSATVYDTTDCYVVDEKSRIGNAYSNYATSKIECEKYLILKGLKDKFPYVIIRPSQTYDNNNVPLGIHGKNGTWQIIKRILEGKKIIIHGDGNTLWTMTRSIDFAQWLFDVVMTNNTVGEIFQITSSDSFSWNKIYSIVADELGRELKAIYLSSYSLAFLGKRFNLQELLLGDKARNIKFNNEKLQRISNYTEGKDMESGIRSVVREVLNNKALHKEDIEYDRWNDKVCELYNGIMITK